MDQFVGEWRMLRARVRGHRVELGLAVRVTVAALLSFALSHVLGLPLPLWTVLTAVVLTQLSFGRSVKASVDYAVGTLTGAIYAGTLAALVPHGSVGSLAGLLAITIAPLTLVAALNSSFSVATLTGVLVVLAPGVTHLGPIASALYRVLEVAIGGITALAVSYLIFPTRAYALTLEAAAQMLDSMARGLPDLFAALTQNGGETEIKRIQDGIGRSFLRLETAAAEAGHERISFLGVQPELGPLLRTLLRLRHDLVIIGRVSATPVPDAFRKRLGPVLDDVATVIADHLHQCGEGLTAHRAPPNLNTIEAALNRFAQAVEELRREGFTKGLPAEFVECFFALAFANEQMRRNLRDLQRCLVEVAGKE